MKLKRFIWKTIAILLTLLGTSLVIFFVMEFLPFDAVTLRVRSFGGNRQALIEAMRANLGVDLPVMERYFRWITGILRGDFGVSLHTEKPVLDIIFTPIMRTLLLNGTAFIVALAVSFPLGIFTATRRSRITDYFSMFLTATAAAIPAYILGLLMIFNISRYVDWLPISGMRSAIYSARGYEGLGQELMDIGLHMLQPVLAMSIVMLGTFVPFIRSALLDVLDQDYMRTAKAKGLTSWSVLFKHALRNALLPLVSLIAMLMPGLIMSNIFIEAVFRWPGVGMLLIDALYDAEVFIVGAIVVFYTLLTLLGSHLADWLNHRIDPRLKSGGHS